MGTLGQAILSFIDSLSSLWKLMCTDRRDLEVCREAFLFWPVLGVSFLLYSNIHHLMQSQLMDQHSVHL